MKKLQKLAKNGGQEASITDAAAQTDHRYVPTFRRWLVAGGFGLLFLSTFQIFYEGTNVVALHAAKNSSLTKRSMSISSNVYPNEYIQLQQQVELKLSGPDVFDPNITSRELVLEKSFPLDWDSCTLQNLLDQTQKKKKLQMVVLAASASARSASNCNVPGHWTGRYPDILENSVNDLLNASGISIEFNVSNMAHGNTDSALPALLVDEFVDPKQADLLLWEFAINDGGASITQKFELFFKRIYHLYASVGRQPPPIILLYLWDSVIANMPKEHIATNGPGTGTLERQWEVIEKYKALGWNIQVVVAGTAVKKELVAENVKILWDDDHHASCAGCHFLSELVLQAFYKDIASCKQATNNKTIAKIDTESGSALEQFMVQNTTRIGSITSFIPKFQSPTLHLDSAETFDNVTYNQFYTDPRREDDWLLWRVPRCNTSAINFTLLEPNLRWLGLGYGTLEWKINLTINSYPIPISRNGEQILPPLDRWASVWVNITDVIPASSQYDVSICAASDKISLMCVVGLMEDSKEQVAMMQ